MNVRGEECALLFGTAAEHSGALLRRMFGLRSFAVCNRTAATCSRMQSSAANS
jgi:hypothetical protein